MSFQTIKAAFESQLTTADCWQVPTSLRMNLVSLFNEVEQSNLSDTEKAMQLQQRMQPLLTQSTTSPQESAQQDACRRLMATQRFTASATKAILSDLESLMMDAVPA